MRNEARCAVCCLLMLWLCIPSAWAGVGKEFIQGGRHLEMDNKVVTDASPALPYVVTPLDKLSRGVTNIFTSILEWPVTIHDTQQQHGWARALVLGPIVGTGRFLSRCGSGVVDVVTFPVPLPREALWVRSPSLLYNDTLHAQWVVGEAATAQQELSSIVPPKP